MRTILSAPAWPYANGPRHIGHVSGFALPCDMFSRYQRMAGNRVLMVSGTDEHGTPIQVQADAEGVTARELADRYNRIIVDDLTSLGMTYDLFTRTTTRNHTAVTQEIFTRLLANGYIFPKTTLGAISPSTGRTLPDRYIEGTCPICGFPSARGDQCDNCGNQLDPADLINPKSKINGETPVFTETEHYFLDLPAFAEVLGSWLQAKAGSWRPNVLKFSLNLLDDLQPRAITRDLDWGVPVPLDGWRDRSDKRIYVWFDAVIGYLSASVEWARRSGDPDAWRAWWNNPDAESYYFMGKDNIVFHAEIWPAMLLGYSGLGARGGQPGPLGPLNLPSEVVSSEYLTMEGRKFSSSRSVVIYVRDFLARYDVDALRYYVAIAGPENQDTDFTWSEFVRRNNDELVATWGNLVNRAVSFAARNIGSIPEAGTLTGLDAELLEHSRQAFAAVGEQLGRSRFKNAITETMRTVAEANKYFSEQAPWKLLESDPDRMRTVLHVTLQLIDDAKTLLTPFLPRSSQQVYGMLGGTGTWSDMPRVEEVDEDGGPAYPVITGQYGGAARWASQPVRPGTPLSPPTPLFTKLDKSVVDEELRRLGTYEQVFRPERPVVTAPVPPAALPRPAPDAHTHLDMIDRPVAEVMAAARAAGVVRAVTVGTDLESSRWSAEAAQQHPDVWAAVAIHPNDTEAATAPAGRERESRAAHATPTGPLGPALTADEVLAGIEALARQPRVVAVGETGLDYYRDHAAPDVQRWWFREHIKIAKRTGKALMIHDREAHADVLRLLAEEGPPARVVFHCFSGDETMARQCAEAGYVMSFAGNVTFSNAQPLRDAAAAAPSHLLLAETDAPFLTPMPNRGRPNEPAQVANTLRCLAQVQGLDLGDLCDLVTATAQRTFGPW